MTELAWIQQLGIAFLKQQCRSLLKEKHIPNLLRILLLQYSQVER